MHCDNRRKEEGGVAQLASRAARFKDIRLMLEYGPCSVQAITSRICVCGISTVLRKIPAMQVTAGFLIHEFDIVAVHDSVWRVCNRFGQGPEFEEERNGCVKLFEFPV